MVSRWLTDLVCYASLSYMLCDTAKSEARMAKIKEEAAADMGKCGLGLLLASVAVACSLHGCTCQRMHEGMSSGACVCAMR